MKIAELRALAEELHMEGAQELKKPVLRKAIHDFLQSPENAAFLKADKTEMEEPAESAAAPQPEEPAREPQRAIPKELVKEKQELPKEPVKSA